MTERAIDRMEQFILKEKDAWDRCELLSEEFSQGYGKCLEIMLSEARRLSQEEKAHKAEAHASLVEELKNLQGFPYSDQNGPTWVYDGHEVDRIVSRYRPTPQADILGEAIKLMKCARNHGGPTAYHDAEDSVGYYVCCGKASYEDHEKDCWYRKMCEFLDGVEGGVK